MSIIMCRQGPLHDIVKENQSVLWSRVFHIKLSVPQIHDVAHDMVQKGMCNCVLSSVVLLNSRQKELFQAINVGHLIHILSFWHDHSLRLDLCLLPTQQRGHISVQFVSNIVVLGRQLGNIFCFSIFFVRIAVGHMFGSIFFLPGWLLGNTFSWEAFGPYFLFNISSIYFCQDGSGAISSQELLGVMRAMGQNPTEDEVS